MNTNRWAILTFLSTLGMLAAAILMVVFVGFEVTQDMEAPRVPFYLEPAGYAFAIWGLIYLGFIALGYYQMLPEQVQDPVFLPARKFIMLNAGFNALWFVGVLSNQLWLTVLCMLGLLYTLIRLSIQLRLGEGGRSTKEKLWVKLPLAMYFGWITVATPINITSFLVVELGLTGQTFLGPEIWSSLILVIAFLIIMTLFIIQQVNAVYLFVGIWGLSAIYTANLQASGLVGLTAGTLALLLFLIFLVFKIRYRKEYALL